jgi:hypothetical protein
MSIHSLHARELDKQLLTRLRDGLLDWEIVVDDTRREIDAAVDRLRLAVRRRDQLAAQVQDLVDKLSEAA